MWVDCDGQGQAWTRSAEKTDIYDDDDDEGETHECIDDVKASAALAFKLIVKCSLYLELVPWLPPR